MSTQQIRIRPVSSEDRDAVRHLALVNGMFRPEEMDGVDEMLSGYLDRSRPDDRWVVALAEGADPDDAHQSGTVVGAAYYASEPFADRVWNLYFLAVDPDGHGRGVGTALTSHVVEQLQAAGGDVARVLLVETSSTDAYQQARAFYAARGFLEEARIRDYYGPGDDKVVFWRRVA